MFVHSPPGTGKTWLIAICSALLRQKYNKNIVIVTSSSYLSQRDYDLFRHFFAELQFSTSINNMGSNINYISDKEFCFKCKGMVLSEYILVVDEVDQHLFDEIF